MRTPPRRLFATVSTLALALSACASGASGETMSETASATSGGDGTLVVVTTSIVGDIVGDVLAGTDASIEVLMATGVDPHAYAPSAQDALRLREADLVVAIGLGLEASLSDALLSVEEDGVPVLRIGEYAEPFLMEEGHGEEEGHEEEGHDEEKDGQEDGHGDGDEHGSFDPHVWLGPAQVALMVPAIVTAYDAVSPSEGDVVKERGDEVIAEYLALADELRAMIEDVPADDRIVVTNHDSLRYLTELLGVKVIGTVLPGTSTQAEPSAADFASLIKTVTDAGVTAVFTEPQSSDRLATSLAEQVGGIELVVLFTGSLGPVGSGAETLPNLLRTNVERIVAVLTQES